MHLTNIVDDAIELSEDRLLQRLRSQGLIANVLVSSHGLRLEAIAAFLMKRLPMPVATTVLPGVLSFPDTAARTWLLWDVAQLSPAQQRELADWMEVRGGRYPVVSISSQPLWPLVAGGRFLVDLYYRLNTILCEATARSSYDEGAAACRS